MRVGRFVRYIVPLLLWMTVIFCASTDRGSEAHTRPVVGSILRRVWPDAGHYLTAEQIDRVDWDIRKCAHVTEYGILSLLLFRAAGYGDKRFRSRLILVPLIVGVLYAATDEYHQSFVPSRGASAADVFTDSYGVLAGTVISLWRWCLRSFRNRPSSL